MRIALKYRIYPTKSQERRLRETLEVCRWLYNHLLEKRKEAYEQTGKGLSLYQQQATFPSLKQERTSLKSVYAQVLQSVGIRLDLAMKAFVRRVKAGDKPGYPRFKGYGRYNSFTYPQNGFKIGEEGKLFVSRIGHIKIILHRPLKGNIKTLTICRSATNKWYASFTVECEAERLPECSERVGIDVGLKTFAILSDGTKITNPRFFRKEEKALAKEQRKYEKFAKGTPERRKHRKVIARLHERIKLKRDNFIHQESHKIVNTYSVIAIEDLHVNRMVHNRCLSKSIRDAAWSDFFSKLFYKAAEAGRICIAVDPAYTSQDCSRCHHRQFMPLEVRVYECPDCSLSINRDLNASLNILALGLQSIGIQSVEAPAFIAGE